MNLYYDFQLDGRKTESLDVKNYSNTRILSYGHEIEDQEESLDKKYDFSFDEQEIEEAKASLEEDYDFLLDGRKIKSLDVRNYSNTRILSVDREIEEAKA